MCDAFKRAYGEVGEEIGRVPVPLKTVKMKKEIVQLAKLKPDFALAVFVGGANNVFFREYYRFKVHETIPVVSTGAIAVSTRLRSYEKTLAQYGTGVGILNLSAYVAEIENPVNQRFVAQYQQTYGALPNIWSMWGYDGGCLLAKALVELLGKRDGAKVVEYMKTLSYISPRHGQKVQFDTHGDIFSPAYILKIERDGDRLVNKLVGQVPPINMDEILK